MPRMIRLGWLAGLALLTVTACASNSSPTAPDDPSSNVSRSPGAGTPSASSRVEVEGSVSSVSGNCPTLTLVVNGTTVTTTVSTKFEDRSCGSIVAGQQVKVKGIRQANGSVQASRVETQDKEEENEEAE